MSFLDIIKKKRGEAYDGDEFGGAAGSDGSGLPTKEPRNFMFATGIECSCPVIAGGVRRDLLEECGHYARWKEDLALVSELGIKVLRYGVPYHRTHVAQGRYDWSWTDLVLAEIRRLGITPIIDLLHFGLPDWLENFQNPELPVHFGDYAFAFASRYPWIRHYTPVNEIFVCARNSAKDGLWNERLKDDRAFVTALKHLVAATTLATHSICRVRPDAIIVQSEDAEITHDASASPSASLTLENKLPFASLDLLYAHPPDADLLVYLFDNGLTRAEYEWKMRGEPPGYQVMGSDYYGRNERIRLPNGTCLEDEDVTGWYQVAKTYFMRYRKPVMHTETNCFDPERAPRWLWKQWVNVLRVRAEGIPVLGFTWYSLTDQVDWDVSLAHKRDRVNACGLYDLDRKARPVARAYRELMEAFGRITIVPKGEMFEVTTAPARLKVEV